MRASTTTTALAVAMLLAAAVAPRAAAFMLPNKPGGGGGSVCAEGTGQPAKLALAAHLLGAVGKGGKQLPVVCLKCAPGTFSWGNNTGPCLPCSACPSGVCADGLCSTLLNFDDIDASAEPLFISELPYYQGFFFGAGITGVLQPGSTPLVNCSGSGAGYAAALTTAPNVAASASTNTKNDPWLFWPALNPGSRFALRSFYASAAYRNGLVLKVEGLDAAAADARVVATFTATLSTSARAFLDFSSVPAFQSVAAVRIDASGGSPSGLCDGRVSFNFGLDNLLTSFVEPVPDGKKKLTAAAALAARRSTKAGGGRF